ncbi:MAG: tetratricopeptide repeat protein [Elusimicrobia bacterium]|nr:tetratricopeptide repeat protein [Elusimicrobiota bacterium]
MRDKISLIKKLGLVFAGILLSMILLESGLRVGGAVYGLIKDYKYRVSAGSRGTYRIMCVGESTTADQWPPLLEEILNSRKTGIRFSVIDKGVAGGNSEIILKQLEDNLDKYSPDMVIAMMGINDRYYSGLKEKEVRGLNRYLSWVRKLRIYKLFRAFGGQLSSARHKPPEGAAGLGEDPDIYPTGMMADEAHGGRHKGQPESGKARDCGELISAGKLFYRQGNYAGAEELFKKCIDMDSGNYEANSLLGELYAGLGKYGKAENMYKTALRLNPSESRLYCDLALVYEKQSRDGKAEEMYEKALEINPEKRIQYIIFGDYYMKRSRYAEAAQVYRRALDIFRDNDVFHGALARCYLMLGENVPAERHFGIAEALRKHYYNPMTYGNYNMMKEILGSRGIVLVCVQYPLLSVKPLEELFESVDNMAFVNNEQIFKDAVAKEGYYAYFLDMNAGEFGHCTDKGNMLLAENIARVVVKKYFDEKTDE